MRKSAPRFCLFVLVLACLAGCASPAKRAQKSGAVFTRLAPADQTLVLRGKVRAGLDQNAVRIAWGEPDDVETIGGDRDPKGRLDGKSARTKKEIWTYRHQLSIYGPLGSSDQWQPGRQLVPPGTPRSLAPGYGIGGPGYEGLLLYRPRIRYVDSYVRRALFADGKLERFETYHGEFASLP